MIAHIIDQLKRYLLIDWCNFAFVGLLGCSCGYSLPCTGFVISSTKQQ
jgi:hypothetical protein